MISGGTCAAVTVGNAPNGMASTIDPKLLHEAAEFVATLNATHAAAAATAGVGTQFRFVMEFVINRDCPQVDVSALPEGILLVIRDNWEEPMGPVFGNRNLHHHVDTDGQQVHGAPPSHSHSHSQCMNPLNAAIPSSASLQPAHRGHRVCHCATVCSMRCVGRHGNAAACTTACHVFREHRDDNCTNRSVTTPVSLSVAGTPSYKKQKRAAATKKGGAKKKSKGEADANTTRDDDDDDDDDDGDADIAG